MGSTARSIDSPRQPEEGVPMRVSTPIAALCCVPLALSTLAADTNGIREVSASARTVIALQTKLRYTTMVVLPDDEEILDVVCGDKDFWVISAAQNIAHIKPAKDGAATNVNLVTASGTIYSFLLTEGKAAQPDLKVYVTADPETARNTPKYVSASQVAALETELTRARAAVDAAQRRSDDAIAAFRQQYPVALQFTYGAQRYEKPFFVRSIWHDGLFTYIKSDARELPALYELYSNEPALVNFQVHGNTYVVPKVIDRGYLALGKDRFRFQQGR
jgi:type IV secretory pathway VirB9-like protein